MPNGSRTPDPPFTGGFKFSMDMVGEIGAFTECSGLAVDIEVEELKEGGQNQFVHKLPSRMKWPNIVLKRGITNSDNLFEWFSKCSGDGFSAEGNALPRGEGEITLLNAAGDSLRSWRFEGAFPVKWTGPTLAAGSREAATEQLEVAHHGFRPS